MKFLAGERQKCVCFVVWVESLSLELDCFRAHTIGRLYFSRLKRVRTMAARYTSCCSERATCKSTSCDCAGVKFDALAPRVVAASLKLHSARSKLASALPSRRWRRQFDREQKTQPTLAPKVDGRRRRRRANSSSARELAHRRIAVRATEGAAPKKNGGTTVCSAKAINLSASRLVADEQHQLRRSS